MLTLGHEARGTPIAEMEARDQLERAFRSGAALQKLAEMIGAHGGNARVTEDPGLLPSSRTVREILAGESCWVAGVSAREIAEVVVDLGGGRRRADDTIDPRVGMEILVRRGDRVEPRSPLVRVHLPEGHRMDSSLEARIRGGFRFADQPVPPASTLLGRLTKSEVKP
jgi:thymidine phosphorylase